MAKRDEFFFFLRMTIDSVDMSKHFNHKNQSMFIYLKKNIL